MRVEIEKKIIGYDGVSHALNMSVSEAVCEYIRHGEDYHGYGHGPGKGIEDQLRRQSEVIGKLIQILIHRSPSDADLLDLCQLSEHTSKVVRIEEELL